MEEAINEAGDLAESISDIWLQLHDVVPYDADVEHVREAVRAVEAQAQRFEYVLRDALEGGFTRSDRGFQLTRLRSAVDTTIASNYRLSIQLVAAGSRVKNLEGELAALRESSSTRRAVRLQESLQSGLAREHALKRQLEEAAAREADLNKQLVVAREGTAQLGRLLDESDRELAELKSEHADAAARLRELEQRWQVGQEDLGQNVADLETKIDATVKHRETLEEELALAQTRVQKLEQELAVAGQAEAARIAELAAQVGVAVDRADEMHEQTRVTINKLTHERDKLQKQLTQARADLAARESETLGGRLRGLLRR